MVARDTAAVTLVVLAVLMAVAAVVFMRGIGGFGPPAVCAVRLLVVAGGVHLGVAALAPGSGWARTAALVLSTALVGLFLLGNRELPGIPLIALGLLLNVVVVFANGAMPVSVEASARAGVPEQHLGLGSDALREATGEGTRLGWLGDVIPVASPWRPQAVSAGDVLVAAGVGLLVFALPRRSRRQGQDARRPDLTSVPDRDSTTLGSYS